MLADAIYFDANWLNPFILNSTFAGAFYRSDNSKVSAQFMHTELVTLPTYSGGGVTALEMPYVGGHYVADILMPTSQSISSFVAGLTPATLSGIEQKLVSTPTCISACPSSTSPRRGR